MLHKLSQKITDHYVKKNKIDDSERDIYEYCFEVLLSTFLNLLAIIILAVATGLYLETLCFTISFMTLRGTAGGYHAKTHWGCFLMLMLVYAVFAVTLFFIPKEILRYLSIGFATVGGIAILILSPVDNVNNQFTIEQTKKYKRKTLVFMAVFLVAYVIMIFFDVTIRYAYSISFVMLAVSISLFAGWIKNLIYEKNNGIRVIEWVNSDELNWFINCDFFDYI